MDYKSSIDNITICGNPSQYVLKNIELNPLIKNYWATPTQLYHYNYTLINGGFMQIKHQTDWHKSSNGIRIEFNPNNYNTDVSGEYMKDLLKNCWNPHLTRRDVAFDFFDVDMNDYLILDQLSRKQRLYRDGKGRFETFYIGANNSDLQIRIYNKAIEKGLKDVTWWRVEAQMRKQMADTFYFNPFTSLKIKKRMDFDKYDWKTQFILAHLSQNPEDLEKMPHNSRLKYKKLLMDDVESVELKLADMFDESARELYEELNGWFNHSRWARRGRSVSIKPIKQVTEIIPIEHKTQRELKRI